MNTCNALLCNNIISAFVKRLPWGMDDDLLPAVHAIIAQPTGITFAFREHTASLFFENENYVVQVTSPTVGIVERVTYLREEMKAAILKFMQHADALEKQVEANEK